MRKQQQVWHNEHLKEATLPSIGFNQQPSSLVKAFIYFLKQRNITPSLKVIDIGSGKGRNTLYLAREGFEVFAIDYIESAIEDTNKLVKDAHMEGIVHTRLADIDKPWDFPDDYFDIAIDCFSSIDIETEEGREIYRNEMFRTLRPGGYAMVAVVSVKDELESALMKEHPGKEKNSVIWPINGKFQKNYEEEELRKFYKRFNLLELKELLKPNARKLDKIYTATNFWIVLQKPQDE